MDHNLTPSLGRGVFEPLLVFRNRVGTYNGISARLAEAAKVHGERMLRIESACIGQNHPVDVPPDSVEDADFAPVGSRELTEQCMDAWGEPPQKVARPSRD
ncbi:hypothetical protein PCL_11806 [Purpureocillium lilacinum]|uniref:Uncharacterized protein n=1 Tax=Purpureocillium lilacinum TaxID=33203 RepID=A0A2U3EB43_PURLI|nr:hypothetical protein Purlil1_6359 [Purpureocillium lilacinum]PWI71712.1 hypothetical protein PCL_11806 [Purpureocillium lilacinum]